MAHSSLLGIEPAAAEPDDAGRAVEPGDAPIDEDEGPDDLTFNAQIRAADIPEDDDERPGEDEPEPEHDRPGKDRPYDDKPVSRAA